MIYKGRLRPAVSRCYHYHGILRTSSRHDFKKLSVFAEEVFKNIAARKSVNLPEDTEIPPYYIPLKLDLTPAKFLKAKPATIESGCDNCGICAEACPMSSIEPEDCTRVTGICSGRGGLRGRPAGGRVAGPGRPGGPRLQGPRGAGTS